MIIFSTYSTPVPTKLYILVKTCKEKYAWKYETYMSRCYRRYLLFDKPSYNATNFDKTFCKSSQFRTPWVFPQPLSKAFYR